MGVVVHEKDGELGGHERTGVSRVVGMLWEVRCSADVGGSQAASQEQSSPGLRRGIWCLRHPISTTSDSLVSDILIDRMGEVTCNWAEEPRPSANAA